MTHDYDSVERMAAEALASDAGMSMEAAVEGIAFQDVATGVMDYLDEALGDASGDIWFDWSDGRGRMKIGVTTRAEPARIEAARRILQDAGLVDRTDFVDVVWSTQELEAAQERAWEVLSAGFPDKPLGAARDPETNSVELYVPDRVTAEELKVVEAAVRAAGVSVRVEPGASYATPQGDRLPV